MVVIFFHGFLVLLLLLLLLFVIVIVIVVSSDGSSTQFVVVVVSWDGSSTQFVVVVYPYSLIPCNALAVCVFLRNTALVTLCVLCNVHRNIGNCLKCESIPRKSIGPVSASLPTLCMYG